MSATTPRRVAALVAAAVMLPIVAVGPVAAAGTSIVVSTLADTAANDGTCSLREAITAANANAVSGAAAGECKAGSASASDTITFSVAGTITEASYLPAITTDLTIDGGGTITVAGADSYRPITIISGVVGVKNLTLAHGYDDVAYGGGLYNHGTATLTNVTIRDSASSYGGGIYNLGMLTVTGSTITDNAAGAGGGIASEAVVSIADSTITGNTAGSFGGGLFNNGAATLTNVTIGGNSSSQGGGLHTFGSMTMTGSMVDGNTATNTGGGISNDGTIGITGSTISENSAGAGGGGLYNTGTVAATRTTISTNTSGVNGGGLATIGGTSTIAGSTVMGNTSVGQGGGLYSDGTTTVSASTFSGNSGSDGGAAFNSSGLLKISDSTLVGNTAAGAGGITNLYTLEVTNSTLTGNSGHFGGIHDFGGASVINSILVGDTTSQPSGDVNVTTGSLVVASGVGILDPAGLADNGGPTRTVRLLATASDAIDQADPTACAATPVSGLDQRGVARSAPCDVGAYEIEHTAPTVTAPKATLRSGVQLSGSALPVHLAWTGADNVKVDHYILERSVNGGPWSTVSDSIAGPSYDLTLAKSSAYRFRVRAVDPDGNDSGVATGPLLGAVLVQQTSSSVHYGQTWTKASSVAFSGGSVKYRKTKGAKATYTFKGRSIAFVTTTGPTRGKAKVYINGVYQTTIDLRSLSTRYRVLAYQKTWSTVGTRTIKIVVSGTSGRPRVDLDAFAVLK